MKKIVLSLFIVMISLALFATEVTIDPETGNVIPQWVQTSLRYRMMQNESAENRAVGSWTGNGPWGGNVRSLAVDASNPDHMMVACGFSMAATVGGAWYSSDAGASWTATDLQGKATYTVAASPSEANVFWAGAKNGLYKTTDNGVSWNLVNYGSTFILKVAVAETNPDLIVVAPAGGNGIRRSADGGTTFDTVGIDTGYCREIRTTPADPSLIVVALASGTSPAFISHDNGVTWTATGPAGDANAIYIDAADANLMILGHTNGIMRSTDGGATWTTVQNGAASRGIQKVGSVLYAAVNGAGVYESTDDGLTWTLNTNGIVETNFQASAAGSSNVYFGFWGGLYAGSGNAGTYALSIDGLNAAFVHDVAYFSDRGELWAVAEGSGAFRSTDGGATWEHKSDGMGSWFCYAMAPHDHILYTDNNKMLVATISGVYGSDDFGESWSLVGLDGEQCVGVEIHPTDPNQMWISSSMGPIKYTADNGASWTDAVGLPFALYPRLKVGKNETGDDRIFVAFEQMGTAVYYSDDFVNYTASGPLSGAQYYPKLSIRPANGTYPQAVYCATSAGVFVSTDYGQTFTQTGTSIFSWSVLGILGDAVFSGTDSGVYASMDGGALFAPLNTNIESNKIWGIVYGQTENQLFAASMGCGVFEYSFEQTSLNPPQNLAVTPLGYATWEAPDTEVSSPFAAARVTASEDTRDFIGYNVYLNENPVANSISELQYQLTDLVYGTEYTAGVSAVYDTGESDIVEVIFTYMGDAAGNPAVPLVTALSGNYPNPFNPTTEVKFSLNETADVNIIVFNIKGEKVKTLVNGHMEAAFHTVTWNGDDDSGRNVGSGIYFYKMRAGKYTSTKKMILMK